MTILTFFCILINSHSHSPSTGHPGNILITNTRADIALLDFGQTKRLSPTPRLKFARLITAIAHRDAASVGARMRDLGICVVPVPPAGMRVGGPHERRPRLTGAEKLAYTMFDTAEVAGVSSNPFADDSALKSATVESFPPDLFFLLRTIQIFKGICSATDNDDFSLAREWEPLARRALRRSRS